MRSRPHDQRGFTVVELAVTVAILGVVAALAYASFSRQRPRANLASATAELQAIVQGARQSALASGHDVAVMVFPAFVNPNGTTGRVIVYEDAFFDFFNDGAVGGVRFATYDPAVLAFGSAGGRQSAILATFDLPREVRVGPAGGMGATPIPAPFAGAVVNVACSFCDAAGTIRRGAIRFDPRGQATFYDSASPNVATPLPVTGGASLSLEAAENAERRTLLITSPSGALRVFGR